jgi:uncharacterized membrane protein
MPGRNDNCIRAATDAWAANLYNTCGHRPARPAGAARRPPYLRFRHRSPRPLSNALMRSQRETAMEPIPSTIAETRHDPRGVTLERVILAIRRVLIPMITLFFLGFALMYAGAAMIEFIRPIVDSGDLIEGLVKGLHMGVVALAVYELAQIIYQEYDRLEAPEAMVWRIRRGIIRFVSVVCTALVLEALIMVIKYNQKDLAGFLFYPVAIIASAALLLISLGVFTKLSQNESVTGNR